MCSVVDEILTSALSKPSLINAKASTQSFYSAEHVFLHYSAVQFPHWTQHHDTPSRPIDLSPDNGLPLVVPPGNVNGGKWSLFSNWVVKKKEIKKHRTWKVKGYSGSKPADSCGFSVVCDNAAAWVCLDGARDWKKKSGLGCIWSLRYNVPKRGVCNKIMDACLTLFCLQHQTLEDQCTPIGCKRYEFGFTTTSWSGAFLFLEKLTWLFSGAAGSSRRCIVYFSSHGSLSWTTESCRVMGKGMLSSEDAFNFLKDDFVS